MAESKKNFAARLTEFRDGAEKDTFWRGYGLNAAKMGRYENQREAPSLEKIIEICEKTRLSPNWLLMGIEPQKLSDPAQSSQSPAAIQSAGGGNVVKQGVPKGILGDLEKAIGERERGIPRNPSSAVPARRTKKR